MNYLKTNNTLLEILLSIIRSIINNTSKIFLISLAWFFQIYIKTVTKFS